MKNEKIGAQSSGEKRLYFINTTPLIIWKVRLPFVCTASTRVDPFSSLSSEEVRTILVQLPRDLYFFEERSFVL